VCYLQRDLGKHGYLWLNSPTTIATKRVSRWLRLKLCMVRSVELQYTGSNPVRGDTMALTLWTTLRKRYRLYSNTWSHTISSEMLCRQD
jgi:hypothetical protein